MKMLLRAVAFGLLCLPLALGLLILATGPASRARRTGQAGATGDAAESLPGSERTVPLYSAGFVDDSGYRLSYRFTGPIRDWSSLAEMRAACRGRAGRGVAEFQARLSSLAADSPGFDEQARSLKLRIGLLHMYEGEFVEAASWFARARDEHPGLSRELRANLEALIGVAALRRGEIENCVACLGPTSCILPIAREAVHQRTEGSREAIRRFTAYLKERPEDLGVRWLLNVACMTLGEYPEKVPREFLIPLARFGENPAPVRFTNVAPRVGLDARGPNMLGGALFDDFTGDGLPDVFVTSGDIDLGASLYVNRGDGTFEDRGHSAGLGAQTMAANATCADFDNDGWLDVLLLRGGWETAYRLSLLRNVGGKTFADVTLASGLGEPIASQSAAWGDYDGDGLVDVYVVGEYHRHLSEPRDQPHDRRNLGRLYHNNGDGTFTDVAASAGVENGAWAKGAAWGDYDDDGRPDLFVSNQEAPQRLYHNNGDGTFTDVAAALGVTGPASSFSCWFWDYDNDGRLDLFVAGFRAHLNDVIADYLGLAAKGERLRLYRNRGAAGFRDVTAEVGLNRVLLPMGSNFGDIDNDGYLDIYLGTGLPSYRFLDPNVLFHNVAGRRFEDITLTSGTGHLQKGHAVSFADWDGDGDLDLFVQLGGQTPGDRAHNVLFQNPGTGHHWLKVKLVGTKTNRAALGAQLRVDVTAPPGQTRSIHRVISSGSSFGGNSLVATFGLGDATSVSSLTVSWPVSKTQQTFRALPADQAIEITEGSDRYRVVNQPRLAVPAPP
jgi:hypothetical protein